MANRKHKGPGLALLCLLLILPAAAAVSQEDGLYVQYRQMLMRAQGANMGMIGAVLAGQLPYKSHIVAHADTLEQNAGLIPDAFKKETTGGKTEALPEIWKNWKEFTAAALALEKESAKLAKVAQSGDPAAIGAQMQKVGAACGGCHKPFRQAK
ncbi:MAG: cytochrome c [Candidatus Adiutricales bacterium]